MSKRQNGKNDDGIALKKTYQEMPDRIRCLILYNYDTKEKIKDYADEYKAEIKNIERKVSGEKGLRVSRIIDMKQVKNYR